MESILGACAGGRWPKANMLCRSQEIGGPEDSAQDKDRSADLCDARLEGWHKHFGGERVDQNEGRSK